VFFELQTKCHWLIFIVFWSVGQSIGQERPNVILLLADDLGCRDAGCLGHPYLQTPALDRLASEGTIFQNCYSAAPVCSASRFGFVTGKFPSLEMTKGNQFDPRRVATVTKVMNELGYRTAHFGKWDIGEVQPQDAFGVDELHLYQGSTQEQRGRDAGVADLAIDFIKKNKGESFYMHVWFHSPHIPVNPSESFVSRYDGLNMQLPNRLGDHYADYLEQYESGLGSTENAIKKYMGEVSQLDDQVGRILEAIEQEQLRDKTIVVFSSDNGPARVVEGVDEEAVHKQEQRENCLGYSGDLRGGKHTLYEGGIRIPWIVRWPGHVPAGKVDETSVLSSVDWLPTLGSIVGAGLDSQSFHGEDVSDIWFGSERERSKDLFWVWGNKKSPQCVVRRGQWKLCVWKGGERELYDVASDPGERSDRSSVESARVEELNSAMEGWISRIPQGGEFAVKWRKELRRGVPVESFGDWSLVVVCAFGVGVVLIALKLWWPLKLWRREDLGG